MSEERSGVYGCMISVITHLNFARNIIIDEKIGREYIDHLIWTTNAWLKLISTKRTKTKVLYEAVIGLLDRVYVLEHELAKSQLKITALEKELGAGR